MNRCHITISLFALLTSGAVAQCGLQLNASTSVVGTPGATTIQAIVALPNGDLIVGGFFSAIGGTPANNIARRSGGSWQALGAGTDSNVQALAVMPNGDLIAGGRFTTAGGVAASRIARWDGANWSPLGSGVSGSQSVAWLGVNALLVRPNGDLVAAGHFLDAGGVAVANIAAWNGTAWSALAGGIPGTFQVLPFVLSLANLPNGDLVAAGGPNRVQQWDGATWSPLNAGLLPLTLGSLTLFVSSSGTLIGTGAERASLLSPVTPFVKQWSGGQWIPFGSGFPSNIGGTAIAELPTGEIVVGGQGPSGNSSIVRSNGGSWSTMVTYRAQAFAMLADSLQIAAGGNDTGTTAGALAEVVSNCPASATNVGAACAGSLGTHSLTATSLPWLGSTFRAVTSAVPASAIALAVSSLSPTTLPLSVVTPIAGAGCDGLVSPDLTELLLPTGNQVTSQIALPLAPVFVGLPIYHYVAVFEFGASGTVVGFTSTGRLLLTLGWF